MKKSDLAVFAILLVSFLALICQIIISATPDIEVEVMKIESSSAFESSSNFETLSVIESSSLVTTSSQSVSSDSQSDLININTADLQTLMKLSKIGEVRANAIINYRNENGPFKKIEDIMDVPGIGEGIFNAIKNDIEV